MRTALVGLLLAGVASANPVTKVVELIKEMKAKIESDAEAEQKSYDKFACWCETTTARKAKAIEKAKEDISKYGTRVLELKGAVATLASEIAELTQEIKDIEESQAKATNIRGKESANFGQEKAEMSQTLNALERAVKVLSGAGTKEELMQAKATIKGAVALAKLSPSQKKAVHSFLQSEYAPQSETVMGILKDMYTTFSTNLESDTEDEMKSQASYEKLMHTKNEAKKLAMDTVASKTEKKAEKEQELADTSQALEDTTNQMNDDAEFFDTTKAACKKKSEDWSERTRLRMEEMDGIDKALDILTSDSARALFGEAIKPGFEFLQTMSQKDVNVVKSAYKALTVASRKSHSLRLAALATRLTKAGHFDKVIKAIDDMVDELDEEGKKDQKDKDFCIADTHKKTEEKEVIEHKIERNDYKIAKLAAKIKKLERALEANADKQNETEENMDAMTKTREEENSAFEKAKSDDEAAIPLLESAIEALSSYFTSNNVDLGPLQNLLQKGVKHHKQEPEFEVSEDQAPETEFSGSDDNAGASKTIISMLTMIKQDLEAELKNEIAAEEEAVALYEEAMKQAEKLLEQLKEQQANLESSKTQAESDTSDEETDKENNNADLDAKNEQLAALKPPCDWLLGAFDKRAEFRASEREGLKQAKALLSGMSVELLQSSSGFDDKKLSSLSFSTSGSFLSRRK